MVKLLFAGLALALSATAAPIINNFSYTLTNVTGSATGPASGSIVPDVFVAGDTAYLVFDGPWDFDGAGTMDFAIDIQFEAEPGYWIMGPLGLRTGETADLAGDPRPAGAFSGSRSLSGFSLAGCIGAPYLGTPQSCTAYGLGVSGAGNFPVITGRNLDPYGLRDGDVRITFTLQSLGAAQHLPYVYLAFGYLPESEVPERPSNVPEPAACGLLGIGLAGLAALRVRGQRSAEPR